MRPDRTPISIRLALLISLVLAVGPSFAAEEDAKKDDEPIVITNEDLLDRYGKPEPAPASAPERDAKESKTAKRDDRPMTPLEQMEQQKSQAADKKERVRLAGKELATAEAKLAALEKQLLATTNPFAARPELSDEEQKRRQETAESASQRHDRTKQQVEKARVEVQQARKKLADAQAGK